jgi:hypothetical protein
MSKIGAAGQWLPLGYAGIVTSSARRYEATSVPLSLLRDVAISRIGYPFVPLRLRTGFNNDE